MFIIVRPGSFKIVAASVKTRNIIISPRFYVLVQVLSDNSPSNCLSYEPDWHQNTETFFLVYENLTSNKM